MGAVEFTDEDRLGSARSWLRDQATRRGAACPCCQQFSKIYKRSLNSGMARSLVVMFREAGIDWLDVPSVVGARSREEGKLRYWELVEEELELRPDGGRAGWWRVTAKGAAFVERRLTVPKYALIYDANLLGLQGPPVSVVDCLRDRFDLAELLGREVA